MQSVRGRPIDGLYAVGNVASGIFGQTYPGGGGTLGPAMTFGHLAGRHAAAQVPREIERREPVAQRSKLRYPGLAARRDPGRLLRLAVGLADLVQAAH